MCTSMYAHQSIQIQLAIKVALLSKGNTKQTQRTQISKAIEQQQSFYIVRVNNRVRRKNRGRWTKTDRGKERDTKRKRMEIHLQHKNKQSVKFSRFSSYCIIVRTYESDVSLCVCA